MKFGGLSYKTLFHRKYSQITIIGAINLFFSWKHFNQKNGRSFNQEKNRKNQEYQEYKEIHQQFMGISKALLEFQIYGNSYDFRKQLGNYNKVCLKKFVSSREVQTWTKRRFSSISSIFSSRRAKRSPKQLVTA